MTFYPPPPHGYYTHLLDCTLQQSNQMTLKVKTRQVQLLEHQSWSPVSSPHWTLCSSDICEHFAHQTYVNTLLIRHMWTLCSFNLCAAGCWTLTPVDLAVADGHGLQGGIVRWVLAVHFPQQHRALVLTTKPQQRQGFQHLAPNSHGNGPSPGTPELPLTALGGLNNNTSMQACIS